MTNQPLRIFKNTFLGLVMIAMLGQSFLSLSLPVKASNEPQADLQTSLSQLQAIQNLNKQNQGFGKDTQSQSSSTLPDTSFDSIGNTSTGNTSNLSPDQILQQARPQVQNVDPIQNNQSDTQKGILDNLLSLGTVNANAQEATDPFLQGFDKGDIQFPWAKDQTYLLTSGYNNPPEHTGNLKYLLNFATGTDKITDPVLAMTDGIVVDAQDKCITNSPIYGCNDGWGKYVILLVSVKDGQNRYIEYHHLSGVAVDMDSVKQGKQQRIPRGQPIGYVGDTGLTNSVPAIQVGLFGKPHTTGTAVTLVFPPIQGKDLELNESPVTDFGSVGKPARGYHHFVSNNTKTTDAYKSRFYYNPVYTLFRNAGYDIPSGTAGDPVNTATGAFTTTSQDVNLAGPGKNIQEEIAPELEAPSTGLKLSRTYNSTDPRTGIFGKGWSTDLLSYVDFFATPQQDGTNKYQFGVSVPGGNTDLFDRTATNCPADNQNPECYSFSVAGNSTGTTASLKYVPASSFSSSKLAWVQSCPTPSSVNVNPDCFNFLYTDKFGNQTLYQWDTATNQDPNDDWKAGLPILTKTRDGQIITYQFDAGTKSSVQDPKQNLVHLQSISNNFGQILNFSFTGNMLSQVVDNSGRTTKYTYNFDGNLVSVTDRSSGITQYGYAPSGLLNLITDPTGRKTLQNNYDSLGRVTSQLDSKGHITRMDYAMSTSNNQISKTTTLTLRDGTKKTLVHDDLGRLTSETDQLGNTNSYNYKDNSFAKTQETDALGRTTKYEYDAQDNPVKITLPDNTVNENTFNQFSQLTQKKQGDRTTTFTYGDGTRLLSKTEPGGAVHQFNYALVQNPDTAGANSNLGQFYELTSYTDPNGNQTKWNFGANNFIIQATNAQGGITNLSYDSVGRLSSRTSPTGGATLMSYDARDNVTQTTNSLGGKTLYSYQANNLLDYKLDPSGLLTIYNYDSNKKLTQTRQCLNTQDVATCKAKTTNPALYDAQNPLGIGYVSNSTGLQDQDKKYDHYDTNFTYDSEDRLLSQTDPEGKITKFILDPKGQRVETLNPDNSKTKQELDAVGNVTRNEDELGRATVYNYDSLNRIILVSRPDQRQQTTTYDQFGNAISIKDFDGFTTQMGYDSRNNLISQTDKEGRTTQLGYDLNNNLTQKVDAFGNKHSLTYSPLNYLSAQTDPNGLQNKYNYDGAGEVVQVDSIDTTNNNTVLQTQKMGYDQAGNLVSKINPLGGISTTKYDSSFRPIESSQYLDDPAIPANLVGTTKVEYDVLGRTTKTTDPKGAITQFVYNPVSKTTQSVDPSGNVSNTHYDIRGNLIKQTNALGDSKEMSYNLDNTLRCQSDYKTYDTQFLPNTSSKFEQYGFDTTKIPANKEVLNGKQTTCYEYDSLKRVAKQIDALGQATIFEYDTAGNLIRSVNPKGQTTAFKYDKQKNLVQSTDTAGFVTKYSYDKLNRPISATNSKNQTIVYGYDSVGNQIIKILPNIKDGSNVDPTSNLNPDQLRKDGWSVSTIKFNVLSSPVSQTDANSQTISYELNPAQQVSKTIDASGNPTVQKYDGLGRLIEKGYSTGSKENYVYDSRNQLVNSTNIYGGASTFEYDLNGNKTKETTPLGNQISYSYDKLNRLTQVSDSLTGDKPAQVIQYDANGLTTKSTDAIGNSTQTRYDPLGRVIQTLADHLDPTKVNLKFGDAFPVTPNSQVSTSYQYDQLGNLTATKNPAGDATTYSYDNQNNLTGVTLPNGAKTKNDFDSLGYQTQVTDSLNRITKYDRDGQNQLTQMTDAKGGLTRMQYDLAGNVIKTQDPNGNVAQTNYVKLMDYLPSESIDPTGAKTTTTYDGLQRATSLTDKKGNKTSVAFNDPAKSVTTQKPEGVNEVATLNNLGQNASLKVGNGAIYTYSYDVRGNLTSTTNPDGGKQSLILDVLNRPIISQMPTGGQTKSTYGPQGELLQQIQSDGETTYNLFDSKLRKVATIAPTSKTGIDLNTGKSSDRLAKTTYSYDSVDNLTQTTDPLGNKTSSQYDSADQVTQITDPNNNSTKYAYDPLGNLTKTTDALNHDSTFEYDANSNLTKSTDANGNPTSFTYSSRNELTGRTDALGRNQTYSYDPNGNEVNWIQANGTVRIQDFDGLNRLKARQYQDKDKKVVAPGTVNFAYDPIDNLTGVNQTNSDNTKLNFAFGYDSMGRMTSQDDGKQKATYSYDQNSNILSQDVAGITNAFNYSSGDKLTKAGQLSNGQILNNQSLNYTSAGQLATVKDKDGKITDINTYDLLGRTTAETHPGNTGYANRQYDAGGRVTSQQNTLIGNESFGYDSLNRLTSYKSKVDGKDVSQSYNYDNAGNRVKSSINGVDTNYTYDKANELNQTSTTVSDKSSITAFSYDPNGNQTKVTQDGTTTSTSVYDGENRAIQTTNGTNQTNTVYDFLQRPISSITSSTSLQPRPAPGQIPAQSASLNLTYTQFTGDRLTQSKSLVSPLPQVLKSGNYTGVMLNDTNTRQLLGATVVTPDWNTLDTANKTRWTFNIHTDSQNTTNSITQVNNSNVILGQTFDPFGNTLKSNLNLGSLSNPLIKTKDDLLNLGVPVPGWQGSTQTSANTFEFGRRSFNSTTGQFTTQDPVANGVSYSPGGSGIVGVGHQDLNRTGWAYSINNQNSLSSREWDGYCAFGLASGYGNCQGGPFNGSWNPVNLLTTAGHQEYYDSKTPEIQIENAKKDILPAGSQAEQNLRNLDPGALNYGPHRCQDDPLCRGRALQNDVNNLNDIDFLTKNFVKEKTETKTGSYWYVPSWREYVGTSEKLFNDEFETQLLLASFCNTDTLYPYNCNDYHSDLAKKYNTTVSPNIAGLSDYQSSHSRWVTYTYDVVSPYFDDSAYSDALATTNSKISQYNKDLNTISDSIKAINLSNKALGIVQAQQQRAQNRDNLNRSLLAGATDLGIRVVATFGAISAAAACTPESFGTLAVPCAIAAYGGIEGAGGALANASSQYIRTGTVDSTPIIVDGAISGTIAVAIPLITAEISVIRSGSKTAIEEGVLKPVGPTGPAIVGFSGKTYNSIEEVAGSTVSSKPLQIHHIATNKSSTYTPLFEQITSKYGLSLDNDFNKVIVPHLGRHPEAYHEFILGRINQIDALANGDKGVFLSEYAKLKQEIVNNPEILYKKP